MTPEDVGALAPAVTREQQLAGLESVLSKVSELQDRSGSTDGFWLAPFIAAQAEGAWKQVSRSTRDHLEEHAQKTTGGWRPPVYFLKFLSSGLKSHDGDAFALLSRMHDAILSGARDFIRDLRALMTENPHWGTFRDLGPDIEIDCADSIATLESIPSGGFIGRYGDNHELARSIAKAVHYLQKALRSKRKELEKLAASPDKIKDRVGGVRDMSDELGDVNVVSLTSHEWCMVKLYPPEDLMDAAELPRDGFLSAFHPLAGTDYLGPGCRSDGQLFLFEQGARLSRHTAEDKKVRFFGAKPFWFQPIPQNRFEIHLSGKSVCFRNPDRDDSRALRGITRLRDAEAMQRLQSEGPGRPFLVHPTTKPSEASGRRPAWTTATARLVTNGTSMWASRAVPYPTMDEAKGGFATWDEAAAARKRFGSGAPYSK